jgi:hypothetical protein
MAGAVPLLADGHVLALNGAHAAPARTGADRQKTTVKLVVSLLSVHAQEPAVLSLSSPVHPSHLHLQRHPRHRRTVFYFHSLIRLSTAASQQMRSH